MIRINPFTKFSVCVGTSTPTESNETVFYFVGSHLSCDGEVINPSSTIAYSVYILDNGYLLTSIRHYNDINKKSSSYYYVLDSVEQMAMTGLPKPLIARTKRVLAKINNKGE